MSWLLYNQTYLMSRCQLARCSGSDGRACSKGSSSLTAAEKDFALTMTPPILKVGPRPLLRPGPLPSSSPSLFSFAVFSNSVKHMSHLDFSCSPKNRNSDIGFSCKSASAAMSSNRFKGAGNFL